MVVLNLINWFFKVANDALDVVLPWLLVPLFLAYPVSYFIKEYKKYRKEKPGEKKKNRRSDLILGTLYLLFAFGLVYFIFWWVPQYIFIWLGWLWPTITLRWIVFALILIGIAYLFGHENGGTRWAFSIGGHLATIFIGWIIQRWIGILFISVPIIVAYYCALYSLATVILPASDPDDPKEKKKRFIVLLSYTWGIQRPLIVVNGHAWKKTETRIAGDMASDLPVKGLVWTQSHQVVGISGGVSFKRVDGPGVVFTDKFERPLQVMDLRLQLRTNEIDVVSKDGIHFKARVFTAFRLDPETWNQETYDKLRVMNPLLRGADRPDYTKGSFPFSHLRVQAAIGVTSSKVTGDVSVYWDQWVLNIIEDTARQIISQKTLDELWKPTKDKKWANALDKIAEELKGNALLTLRSAGILVVAARVVNFSFPATDGKTDDISDQQISTWESEWARKRSGIMAEAQAESDRTQQEAHAYAESLLLNSIAEGLQKTGEMHPRLPRYVIAMRYLSALQDYIHKQPIEGESAAERDTKMMEHDKKIKELQGYISTWQAQFFPPSDKEK
jgi:hypothetical protein